jgi:uncharacterized protein (TIGR02246 family)
MTTPNDQVAAEIVADIAKRFEAGWNANDGVAYVEPLTDDADYITIQGLHASGRQALAEGINALYATVYKGSVISIEATKVRVLAPGTIMAQLQHNLTLDPAVVDGPTDIVTLASVVVTEQADGGWRVAALHNTVVAEELRAPVPG